MTDRKYEEVKKLLKEKLEEIWDAEPDEVGRLRRTTGTQHEYFPNYIYAEEETRLLTNFYYCLDRAVTGRQVDLGTIKELTSYALDFFGGKIRRWYKMKELPKLMEETSSAIKLARTKEEYVELLRELWLYTSRLNYWIDSRIPWYKLSRSYESTLKDEENRNFKGTT